MNTRVLQSNSTMLIAACGLTELVRGEDRELVERLEPVVRKQCVALDLASVERIDAAGIAALISLYGMARDAGHRFAVANPNSHVREILELVGLDRILVSKESIEKLEEEPCLSAA